MKQKQQAEGSVWSIRLRTFQYYCTVAVGVAVASKAQNKLSEIVQRRSIFLTDQYCRRLEAIHIKSKVVKPPLWSLGFTIVPQEVKDSRNNKYIHRSRLQEGEAMCLIKTPPEITPTRRECTSSLLLDFSHSASALEFVGFSTVLGGSGCGGFFRRKRLLRGCVGGLVYVGRGVRGLLHWGLEHGLRSETRLRN